MELKSCPSPETLRRCAVGRLSNHEADSVLDHLDDCVTCEEFLATVEVPHPIGVFNEKNDYRKEPECTNFVKLLSGESPATPERPKKHDDLSGRRIRDYQLIRQLGRGGMGTVYLARHTRLNKLVALKLVPDHSQEDPSAVTRFEREMQAVGLFEHPNVVGALDAGDVDGLYFLTMELVDGIDLSRYTKAKRQLRTADACEVVRQTAEGMQYAHDQGLIHRDLKPSNLMLGREPDGSVRAKVLDLGLALMPESENDTAITDPTLLLGTLEYMSPEQAGETTGITHLADIYSLGATLYRLLTGTTPFNGPQYRNPARRLLALTVDDAPSIRTQRDDLPAELATLVDCMLSRNSDQRPQRMSDVAATLLPFCSGHCLPDLLVDVPASNGNETPTVPSDLQQQAIALNDTSPTAAGTIVEARGRASRSDALIPVGSKSLTDGSGGNSRHKGWLLFAVALPLVILGGVIWLMTDQGSVRVEHDDDVELTLQVLKDGAAYGVFRLDQHADSVTYRTGQYEFRIPREVGDQIRIENASFYLERNAQQVVKITRVKDRDDTVSAPEKRTKTVTTETNGSMPNLDSKRPSVHRWTTPVNLSESINSEWNDDQATISADGLTMIFGSYCIPRFAGEGDRDLWMTTRPDTASPWEAVSNLGSIINTSMKESHPSFHSPSGLLAFASNRQGGLGEADLWYSMRSPNGHSWSRPINMGPKANSKFIDDNPEISSDGLTLVFSSTRDSAGSKNLWQCKRSEIDDRWGQANMFSGTVNSSHNDGEPALSANQLTLLFTSNRPGGYGGQDLWMCTRPTRNRKWTSPVNLGETINTSADETHAAFLPDGKSLIFASTRDGGLGGTDLYYTQRISWTAPNPTPHGKAPAVAKSPFDVQQAGDFQRSWAEHLEVPVEYKNSIGMRFHLIPPGEFQFGAAKKEHVAAQKSATNERPSLMNMEKETDLINSESPQRHVKLTQPFYMATFEVRERDFDQLIARKQPFTRQSPDHPIGLISWLRAALFCNALSRHESMSPRYEIDGRNVKMLEQNRGYRLPTEAEWEFACRAGSALAFPFGDDASDCPPFAWYIETVDDKTSHAPSFPVGQKKPNQFGLFDMLGNHWEWCEDAYVASRIAAEPWVNPLFSEQAKHRIGRGGFVLSIPGDLRNARRRSHMAHMPYRHGGFRVVLSLGPENISPVVNPKR